MILPSCEARKLLMFDVESGGHHAEYALHLLRGLSARLPGVATVLAVPQEMLDRQPELALAGVEAAPLPPPGPPGNPWAVSKTQWACLHKVVQTYRPTDVLLLYADSLLPTLARHASLPGRPRLATIHFRPPVSEGDSTVRERVRDIVKRYHLRRALSHPDLRAAFSLDPRAVPTLRAQSRATVVALPDPVGAPVLTPDERTVSCQNLRSQFRVGPDQHLMVLFGALARRKGIFEVLGAIRCMPEAWASRLTVAFVGPVDAGDATEFAAAVAVTTAESAANLVVRSSFITDGREIEALLSAADTVLLPYQRHIGSSAVLIRAAALQRPTICQDYGLVGEWTRAHRLGRSVDSTDPKVLAKAFCAAIADPSGGLDADASAAFAAAHTPEAFVTTVLDGLAAMR